MHRLQVSIQEFPTGYTVVFIEGNRGVGPTLRLKTEDRVFELMRRVHANLETMNIVEMAITAHRPCMVDVNLSDEQYIKLKKR